MPTSPDGSKSACPATGIKYVPKYLPASTATSTSSAPTATATQTPFLGKGFLQATTSGAQKGCLISAGTWYTTGTCATYTAAISGNYLSLVTKRILLIFVGTEFTLTSSKGSCDIIAGAFSCAAGNRAGVFTVSFLHIFCSSLEESRRLI